MYISRFAVCMFNMPLLVLNNEKISIICQYGCLHSTRKSKQYDFRTINFNTAKTDANNSCDVHTYLQ